MFKKLAISDNRNLSCIMDDILQALSQPNSSIQDYNAQLKCFELRFNNENSGASKNAWKYRLMGSLIQRAVDNPIIQIKEIGNFCKFSKLLGFGIWPIWSAVSGTPCMVFERLLNIVLSINVGLFFK